MDIKTKDWGTDQIDLRDNQLVKEFKPVEIHHKSDGSLKNKPSFLFVLYSPISPYKIIGQISLQMLNQAMNELGYKITEK